MVVDNDNILLGQLVSLSFSNRQLRCPQKLVPRILCLIWEEKVVALYLYGEKEVYGLAHLIPGNVLRPSDVRVTLNLAEIFNNGQVVFLWEPRQ